MKKYGIATVPFSADLDFDISYEDCFWKTFHLFAHSEFLKEDLKGQLIYDLIGAFVPRVLVTSSFRRLREAIHNRDGEVLFCQFRIENDWIVHCRNEIIKVRSASEELYVDYMKIGLKIANTFPNIRNVFICADEPSMPASKEQIKLDLLQTFGIRALFKTDFLGTSGDDFFRPNEHSLIDMALCVDGKNFVGTTRSTFSNMVALQRYSAEAHKEQSYIYNHMSLRLKRRVDNGAAASVDQAVPVSGKEIVIKDTHIAKLMENGAEHPVLLREGASLSFEDTVDYGEKIELQKPLFDERLQLTGNVILDKSHIVML